MLKPAGYVSGLIGKWHLGAASKFHPMKRGFDEMFGFLGGGHDYFRAEPEGTKREYLIPIERNGKPVEEPEYLTDAFSREAAAFVRRHTRDPFFLYLPYNAPHTPLQVTDNYLDRVAGIQDETRRKYAAMICAIDDGVGRIMETLRETKLDRDTLVFFLSDNGGANSVSRALNRPLRSGKAHVFEGGIRVPFVMHWPGRLPAGKSFDHPVTALDILPTAAAVAGAPLPEDRKIDGVNLMPFVAGGNRKAPHHRLFWRWGPRWAVREGRYKLLRTAGGEPQLFDLEKDVGESRELAGNHPDRCARLQRAYDVWNEEMIEPLFPHPAPHPDLEALRKR